MRLISLFLGLLVTIPSVSQITPEEKEIRETYSRIALASEIYAVQNVVTGAAKNDVDIELEKTRLQFKLSDFRVGDLRDHLNDPYKEFVSRLNGQDHLQIDKGTYNLERDHRLAYHNVYAAVRWVRGGQVAPVDWDNIPLGHVVDAAHATDGSTMVRFASFTVQTTYQGEVQTTRATWWYGTDKNGKPLVLVADNLNGSAAVAMWRGQSVYPYALIDDPETRKNPVVGKWLKSVAQDCPGNKHDNCYDATSGKAGISREDIDRGSVLPKEPV